MSKSVAIAENQKREGLRKYKLELINKNLLENYEKR